MKVSKNSMDCVNVVKNQSLNDQYKMPPHLFDLSLHLLVTTL